MTKILLLALLLVILASPLYLTSTNFSQVNAALEIPASTETMIAAK